MFTIEGSGGSTDVMGKLRSIPNVRHLASGGALLSSDIGGHVSIGANSSLDAAILENGQVVSVLNTTASDLTLTITGTAYVSGFDTARTSVTVLKRGLATILKSNDALWITGGVA